MKSGARVAALVLIIVALSSIGLLDKAAASLLQSPTNPGTTNLSSWWSLNETSGTRYDGAGTNHLTDNNTVGYASGIQGNAATYITGNHEYLNVADNASLDGGAAMTVGGWMHPASIPGSGYVRVLSKWDAPNSEYWLYITAAGSLTFGVSADGSTTASSIGTGAGTITTGSWYFFVAWLSPNDSHVHVQVNNGTVFDGTANVAAIYDSTKELKLGSWGDDGLNGDEDEVFLYQRELSADERSWLYNSGSGRRYCEVANNCPEYQTATAEANQTGTANALTATYDAQLTGTAGALTATYYPMLTGTAAALTATQVFSDDLQTVIAGYRTQRAALTYTPTVTLTATLTRTPDPAPQFESTISYGDIARTNALACIATIGGLWGIVWVVVTFLSKRRRT